MNEKKARKLRREARNPPLPQPYLGPAIYLDTSVLRKAGTRLRAINKDKKAITSGMAIQELLNGMRLDEDSFARRRGALKNLLDAEVRIDWTTEESIMISTFGQMRALSPAFMKVGREQVEKPLKRVIEAALEARDSEGFRRTLRERSLEGALARAEDYDEAISSHWVTSVSEGNRESKQVLDEINQGIRPRPPGMIYGTTREFSEQMLGEMWSINRHLSIRALADRASRCLAVWDPGKRVIPFELLVPSYNGRADIYADALAVWWMKKYENMGTPGRNDGMDLLHFMYAGTRTTFLTEDSGQRDVARAVGLSAPTLDEYLGACCSNPRKRSTARVAL